MTTSTYAARISEHPDQPFAAIAPRNSAREYGLELILAGEDIQKWKPISHVLGVRGRDTEDSFELTS